MRRALLLLTAALAAALLAGSAGAAEARKKSPRLHAFRSCENLVGYAQRNGIRLIRDTPLAPLPPPVGGGGPIREGGGAVGGDGGGSGGGPPPPMPAPMPVSRADGDGSSQTNVQEAGVDEPDWVKTAGTRLLVAGRDGLTALDAGGARARVLGTLPLAGTGHELLVRGGRALVMARLGFGSGSDIPLAARAAASVPPADWLGRTRLLEVDVSDPAAMRVVRTLDVEGSYLNARLTGSTARVVIRTQARGIEMPPAEPGTQPAEVTARWQRKVRRTRARAWLPATIFRNRRTGKVRRRSAVGCRQVRRPQAFSGLGTITVLTIDMERGLPAVDADSLMIDGDTVYASEDRLYVASQRWLGGDPTRDEILDRAATGLHAFSTEHSGETAYLGSGEIPGYLLNQWSLSEHRGVLRAATTSMPPWNPGMQRESAVRTLEEREGRLVQIGKVGGLGRDERIYAVRYIGETGFVVTFRQVDPLYTIDLSDPREPRVMGELKVPGYSAYLHPVGDGLLLGVGQDATDQGMRLGLQMSLFDIEDLRAPARLDRLAFGRYATSSVEYDHRAFLWWAPQRLAVLPVSDHGSADAFTGAVAVRVDRAGGVRELGRVPLPSADPYSGSSTRPVIVGDRLLLVSPASVLSTALSAPGAGERTPF